MVVDGHELLAKLRKAFPPDAYPAVPWIDLPAALYALAGVESRFGKGVPEVGYVVEPDKSISVGVWQVNQSPEWLAHHDGFTTPAPDASIDEEISAINRAAKLRRALTC